MDVLSRLRALLDRRRRRPDPSAVQAPTFETALAAEAARLDVEAIGVAGGGPAEDEADTAIREDPFQTVSNGPTLPGVESTERGGAAVPEDRTGRSGKMAERIGRYEIEHEIGRGGMGIVYKARDPQIGRTVAIKSILPSRLTYDVSMSEYEKRFFREGQAAGRLSHPGIVAVHDLIFDDEQSAIVMEFVEGDNLEHVMARERLPLERCLDIILEAAMALDHAHEHGVVHRDIKPANILLTRQGRVKISDFGVARLEGSTLTRTGQVVGTPAFMSPEQFVGSPVDGRSDLFSLGSVLYWMCTGQKPFSGRTMTAIGIQLVHADPVPARELEPELPLGIELILSRLLAKKPEERYASGAQLAADLEALKAGRPLAAWASDAS